jgi:hypothetical protein
VKHNQAYPQRYPTCIECSIGTVVCTMISRLYIKVCSNIFIWYRDIMQTKWNVIIVFPGAMTSDANICL